MSMPSSLVQLTNNDVHNIKAYAEASNARFKRYVATPLLRKDSALVELLAYDKDPLRSYRELQGLCFLFDACDRSLHHAALYDDEFMPVFCEVKNIGEHYVSEILPARIVFLKSVSTAIRESIQRKQETMGVGLKASARQLLRSDAGYDAIHARVFDDAQRMRNVLYGALQEDLEFIASVQHAQYALAKKGWCQAPSVNLTLSRINAVLAQYDHFLSKETKRAFERAS